MGSKVILHKIRYGVEGFLRGAQEPCAVAIDGLHNNAGTGDWGASHRALLGPNATKLS